MTAYETRFTCFVDLLGFSQLIASGQEESTIAIVRNTLNEFVELQDRSRKESFRVHEETEPRRNCVRVSFFSDCLALSADGDYYGFMHLRWACIKLCETMLKFGHFVRGAMTFGRLYHDPANGVVFGPALVHAYNLESRVAVYPRIILDQSALTELRRYDDDHIHEIFEEIALLDDDGLRYLSFLEPGYIDNFAEERKFYTSELYSILEDKLARHVDDERVHPKVAWMAREFNRRLVANIGDFDRPVVIEAPR